MARVSRRAVRAAEAEARRLGLTVSVKHGSKHPKLIVARGPKARKTPFPGSPRSDEDNLADWLCQAVRRMNRELS